MSDLLTDPSSSLSRDADILRLPFVRRNDAEGFPAVRAVQQHWDELRGTRLCPARAELDPKPLSHCLDVMFVAELVAPSVARLRLTGQQLGDLLGMDPRGMPLSVFFDTSARNELAGALAQVAQGARVLLPLRSDASLGQPALDGLLALLPLSDTQGRITRILGVLETRGPAGRAPRRFRLSAPMRTEGFTETGPERAAERAQGRAPGFSLGIATDRATGNIPPRRPAPGKRPRFHVIKGGKA